MNLKQLQNMYLGMIEEFHNFCIKNSLIYYMVGGTLLGAVREKGFIPWDDDVDFAMPRPDYEKFVETYQGNLIVGHYKKIKSYIFPYVKLLNKEKPFVEIHDEEFNINSAQVSVHFDIYPIDGVGKKTKKHLKCVNFYKKLWYDRISKEKSKSIIKNLAYSLIRCIPTRFFTKKIDKAMSGHDFTQSEMVTRWRGENSIFPKSLLDTPVKLPFESLELNAPKEYDKYLTFVYGDYMKPKQENANARHDVNNLSYLTVDLLKKNYNI